MPGIGCFLEGVLACFAGAGSYWGCVGVVGVVVRRRVQWWLWVFRNWGDLRSVIRICLCGEALEVRAGDCSPLSVFCGSFSSA